MWRSAFIRALRTGMLPSLVKSAEWASKLKAQAIKTSNPASPASRVAPTRSGRETVPNSEPQFQGSMIPKAPTMEDRGPPVFF